LEDGAAVGAEKILPRQQRTAARRTARRRDERVLEKNAFAGDTINVRRLEDLIDRGARLDGGVTVGVASPIVSKTENDIRSVSSARRQDAEGKQG